VTVLVIRSERGWASRPGRTPICLSSSASLPSYLRPVPGRMVARLLAPGGPAVAPRICADFLYVFKAAQRAARCPFTGLGTWGLESALCGRLVRAPGCLNL
jgi:hypothetical protein